MTTSIPDSEAGLSVKYTSSTSVFCVEEELALEVDAVALAILMLLSWPKLYTVDGHIQLLAEIAPGMPA